MVSREINRTIATEDRQIAQAVKLCMCKYQTAPEIPFDLMLSTFLLFVIRTWL